MLADMAIQRMANLAIVVDDLDAAVTFFGELGMELEGRGPGRRLSGPYHRTGRHAERDR